MHAQLMQDYNDLMAELTILPGQIDKVQTGITDMQLAINALDRKLTERDAALMQRVEGKNAEARKADLVRLQGTDSIYSTAQRDKVRYESDLARAKDELDYLTRSYGAVSYRTRLHAALLNYLGSAGAPVELVPIGYTRPAVNGNGMRYEAAADTVSADDAAALGL